MSSDSSREATWFASQATSVWESGLHAGVQVEHLEVFGRRERRADVHRDLRPVG
jgi:hypothetical protein